MPVFLFAGLAGVSQAATRVALVIGNAAYTQVGALTNPRHDAEDMATRLERYGFEVVRAFDLAISDVPGKLQEFAAKLKAADAALLFYAGHGVAVDGENFLIPVDARLETAGDLENEAVPLGRIQRIMERVPRTNVLIFDACRNNPFADKIARSLGDRGKVVGQGWAAITPGRDTYISFATAPGTVARDGSGRNSPFTTALLARMSKDGEDIQLMMRGVRADVIETTRGKQIPWEHSSLISSFVIASAKPQSASLVTAERTSYQRGESIQLIVTPHEDCRLTLINVDKAGKSCLLFPHPKLPDTLLKAGARAVFPPKGALRLDQPGEETFVALCNASAAAKAQAVRTSRLIDCSMGAADRAFNDKVFETVTFDLVDVGDKADAAVPGARQSVLRGSLTVTVSE